MKGQKGLLFFDLIHLVYHLAHVSLMKNTLFKADVYITMSRHSHFYSITISKKLANDFDRGHFRFLASRRELWRLTPKSIFLEKVIIFWLHPKAK